MAKRQKKETKYEVNLPLLIERFGSEDKCRVYLEALRWHGFPKCPRCFSNKLSRIEARNQFDCDSCRYQFSVTAGTIFHDSHLPLWKWFLAVYMMVESKKGLSANQMKRTLSVSYKTAWYLCHRIRTAMEAVNPAQLDGTVECDETWIGGKRRHVGRGYVDNKTMVLGALQRGGEIRLRVERRADRPTLHKFIAENVADKTKRIMTDEHPAYNGIADHNTTHETVNHHAEEWVRGDVHTNGIEGAWSLFKRSVVASYHQVSAKHLARYLDEFEWRFNQRRNRYLFRDTIMKLVEAPKLTYAALTA